MAAVKDRRAPTAPVPPHRSPVAAHCQPLLHHYNRRAPRLCVGVSAEHGSQIDGDRSALSRYRVSIEVAGLAAGVMRTIGLESRLVLWAEDALLVSVPLEPRAAMRALERERVHAGLPTSENQIVADVDRNRIRRRDGIGAEPRVLAGRISPAARTRAAAGDAVAPRAKADATMVTTSRMKARRVAVAAGQSLHATLARPASASALSRISDIRIPRYRSWWSTASCAPTCENPHCASTKARSSNY